MRLQSLLRYDLYGKFLKTNYLLTEGLEFSRLRDVVVLGKMQGYGRIFCLMDVHSVGLRKLKSPGHLAVH